MTRSIALVLHPGFQLLDAAGPIAAFEMACRMQPGAYRVTLLAPDGGAIASSAGPTLLAAPLDKCAYDTVIVAGGEITRSMDSAMTIVEWLSWAHPRRVASVCSGAYLLAEAGLLDGKRATTHWNTSGDFSRRYPQILLDADRIFVRDGNVWTSAGISAGIDLALALIEDDLGEAVAAATAQQLVVPRRRAGGQSQLSGLVELGGRTGRFGELMVWVEQNLREDLTVETLAEQTNMSPRNFARAFAKETGTTPARAVERLRVNRARTALETTGNDLQRISEETGFGGPGRMRRAFIRCLGHPPQALRRAARG